MPQVLLERQVTKMGLHLVPDRADLVEVTMVGGAILGVDEESTADEETTEVAEATMEAAIVVDSDAVQKQPSHFVAATTARAVPILVLSGSTQSSSKWPRWRKSFLVGNSYLLD